uniref:ABC transporter permease n=1 Tax=Herbiconiux solani TaxID=661329 RepID=UPI000824D7E3
PGVRRGGNAPAASRPARAGDRVPGPLRRFGRRGLRIVALGLIGLVLLAASFLQSTASEQLKKTLDANWRGDYDILVTAAGASPLIDGEETLLPSAALTDSSLGHIPDDLVYRVEGLEGIDVAAPIGEISTTTTGVSKVTLTIPLDGSSGPRAYRATTSLAIDDGVSAPRTVEQSVDFVVDQSTWEGFQPAGEGLPDRPVRVVTSAGGVGYGLETDIPKNIRYVYGGSESPQQPPAGQGVAALTLPVQAVKTAHIVLVDPKAEKALLGDSGSVMDPLIDTSGLIGRLGDQFFTADNPPVEGDDLLTLFDKGVATMPTPVLTRTVETPSSELTVQLAPLDAPQSVTDAALQGITDDGDGVRGLDLSRVSAAQPGPATTIYSGAPGDALSPLSFDTVDIPWPGWTMPELPSYAHYPLFRLTGSPILSSVTPMADSVVRPTVVPPSAGDPDAEPSVELTASGIEDGELIFDTQTPIPSFEASGLGPIETNTWPVGSFSPADLHSAGAGLGQVGLGYDAADPVALNGTRADGATAVPPSWSGLGLNTAGALAVADLDNALALAVDDPVSSIRVRVADVEGYSPEAQARILDVANRIRDLGLTATVVSGSSFESIPVTLRGPVGEADADADGSTGSATATATASPIAEPQTAPVVSLEYSRLGAAASAAQGVSATNLALLVMAMLAGSALLITVQLSSIAARRTDSVVLRQIGWPRARIRRWLLAEEAVPLVILLAVGAGAILLSAVKDVTWPLVVLAVGSSLLTSAVLIGQGANPPSAPKTAKASTRRARLASPSALGLRLAVTYRASTATLALAFALVFLAAATAAAVLQEGRTSAGPTRLGAFATASALVPQGILIAVTLAASCVLIVVVRRLGLARRTTQTEALRAMGWQRRHLERSAVAEVLSSAVPGFALGAAFAVVGTVLLLPDTLIVAVVSGVVVTSVVTAVVIRASAPKGTTVPAMKGRRRGRR